MQDDLNPEIHSDVLGEHLENWLAAAPELTEVDQATREGMDALVEAGMVQYDPNGWDFKLHEKHPDAPKALFKLMIREAPGVDTNPAYYDRFVLPLVLQADEEDLLEGVDFVLGYPNAGTPIASAFVRLAGVHLGTELQQLQQVKILYPDGTRELGPVISDFEDGQTVFAVDDTAVGGRTKKEGWQRIIEQNLDYRGLGLIVERDPLGSALVRQETGSSLTAAIHWITLAKHAARVLDLPEDVVQKELEYPVRLFEWNVANNNLGSLPRVESLSL